MLQRIKEASDHVFDRVVSLRRQIHRNPELAFEEFETARLVAESLAQLGLDVTTGVARTGVVATLEGKHPGPTRALRADMDALPILEENTFDFVSRNPGRMHACGHDAHTSSLLGAAMVLHELRDELHGTVRFMFQPSEEQIPGGAPEMIADGALGDASTVFGQHVEPKLEAGMIGVRPGSYMASVDELHFEVMGQGGHAAEPHALAADAVVVAAHIILALQSVISRNSHPASPSILSIGRVVADGATNVIPHKVEMKGTFRAMDETWRNRAHALIERVATSTALAYGATCNVEIRRGYPALDNDPAVTAWVREAACEYVGEECVVDLEPWFAGEDFAYYLKQIPGTFYRLGTANLAKGIVHGLHTPRFTIEEESLRVGVGFMAFLGWKQGLS